MARGHEKTHVRNNHSEAAWQKAYQEIKHRILTMQLKPGNIVSELAVAKELQLSRTPVREAIKRLEHEGLVASENRRKRVYIVTIHEVNEIFDLKVAIEGRMARFAALRKSAEQARQLESILERMRRFAESDLDNLTHDHAMIHEWLVIDREFHHVLFAMAQNRKAEQIINNLNSQWHRLALGILAMEGRLKQNIAEHLEMGSAILAGEPDRSEELMSRHLAKLHNTITNIMEMFHFPT